MPLDSMVLPAIAACLEVFPETRFRVEATDLSQAADLVRDGRAVLAVTDISELPSSELLQALPLRRHPLLGLGRPASMAEAFRHPSALSVVQAGRYSAGFARC